MKIRKILIPSIFVSCTLTAFGQNNTSEQNLHAIVQVSHEIDSLFNQIEKLKRDTSLFHGQLESFKKQWKESCENYIKNASTLTESDFDWLIANTRPNLDGEDLFKRLEDAKKNLASEEKTPVPLIAKPVKPVIKDPKEGVVEDGKPKEDLKPVDDHCVSIPTETLEKDEIKEKTVKTTKQ